MFCFSEHLLRFKVEALGSQVLINLSLQKALYLGKYEFNSWHFTIAAIFNSWGIYVGGNHVVSRPRYIISTHCQISNDLNIRMIGYLIGCIKNLIQCSCLALQISIIFFSASWRGAGPNVSLPAARNILNVSFSFCLESHLSKG